MNYWPAENCNCSKAVAPLTHFVKMMSSLGAQTAREVFGADGWTMNHTTDVFGRTGIHDSVDCGFFPIAGSWMCLPLWEHYEFTGDRDYLSEIYPILEGSCRFILDYLTEAPEGYLTTCPSNSPENSFYYTEPDGERKRSMLTHGATIDFEIINALFTRTMVACEILGKDMAFAQKLADTLHRLPPLRVSDRYGIICEWNQDYEETEPGHRHISQLVGLYPLDQINESDTALFEAAQKTIERRISNGGDSFGSNHVGWSQAWMVNFYARLKNGEEAGINIRRLLVNCTSDNLFDIHPPQIFQIDGNFGGTAGIAEMLLQSHLGKPCERVVDLLPALPPTWKNGYINGIKARGNLTFDMAWEQGSLTKFSVTAETAQALRVKVADMQPVPMEDIAYTVKDGVLVCDLPAGKTVTWVYPKA